MLRRTSQRMVFALAAAVLLTSATARADTPDALAKTATWQPSEAEQVRSQVMAVLQEKGADQAVIAQAERLWADLPTPSVGDGVSSTDGRPTETDLLTRLAGCLALVDPDAAALVELCSQPKDQYTLPAQPWLTDPGTPPLVAHNMRLLYGRWLVHEELYDEALEQFADLEPGDVVAPASLLFFRSVAHHSLLEKEPGLKVIEQLLSGQAASPRRYIAIARLMLEDLEALEDDTLDHIARRMGDIRRRLDLGRAGKKVRKVEDGVIESLDKLIKKVEEQQKQCSGGGISDSIHSSRPAPDSLPMGGKGPGEVTKRRIGSGSGWGDLPPKEREEALQQIGREFPAHYREIIEQYFRRLAADDSE